MKNTTRVSRKLIRAETFRDRRNRYFGTFTLVKMPALATRKLSAACAKKLFLRIAINKGGAPLLLEHAES